MADPEEVTRGLGNFLRQGMGVFGQGVNAVAQVLRSGDSAVREVDSALTGLPASAAPSPLPRPGAEQRAAEQVASLLGQGKAEAERGGDARAAGVVARFREALRLLFQVPLNEGDNLLGPMPSPMDMLRRGLRDLRGSMALVRLANGTGSLDDVEEVAGFGQELISLAQGALPAVGQKAQASKPSPSPKPKSPSPPPAPKTRRRTAGGGRKKQGVVPSSVVFARALAEEMGEKIVGRWAAELERGRITEDQFIERWSRRVAEGGQGNADELLAKAKERAIRGGLSPSDPYLQGI